MHLISSADSVFSFVVCKNKVFFIAPYHRRETWAVISWMMSCTGRIGGFRSLCNVLYCFENLILNDDLYIFS